MKNISSGLYLTSWKIWYGLLHINLIQRIWFLPYVYCIGRKQNNIHATDILQRRINKFYFRNYLTLGFIWTKYKWIKSFSIFISSMRPQRYYLLIFLLVLALIPNYSRCVSSFPILKILRTKNDGFRSEFPQPVSYQTGNIPFIRLSRSHDSKRKTVRLTRKDNSYFKSEPQPYQFVSSNI